jgi:rare lipoprotein A
MRASLNILLVVFSAFIIAGCARSTTQLRTNHALKASQEKSWDGIASWYGGKFHGRCTASGEIFNMNHYTAAHRTLPFNTRVRVTNLRNGRYTIVRINDRGPFVRGREIDLSYMAARDIGMLEKGLERVKLEILAN